MYFEHTLSLEIMISLVFHSSLSPYPCPSYDVVDTILILNKGKSFLFGLCG